MESLNNAKQETYLCPMCKQPIKKGAVVCGFCGYIPKEEPKTYPCPICKRPLKNDDVICEVCGYKPNGYGWENLPEQPKTTKNVPRCPTCGSTNIESLGAVTRGIALGLFGIASKTARSQFWCKNCNYKW